MEIEEIIKCLQAEKKNPEPDGASIEFYQRITFLIKVVHKVEHNEILSNLFYEYSIALLSKVDNYINN